MNKHQFPWEECVCYSHESETLQRKLIRKRRKATLLWYISGGGKLSRVRMCDAPDQKLSDNTHLRWGLPPGILNDCIWSRFQSQGKWLGTQFPWPEISPQIISKLLESGPINFWTQTWSCSCPPGGLSGMQTSVLIWYTQLYLYLLSRKLCLYIDHGDFKVPPLKAAPQVSLLPG